MTGRTVRARYHHELCGANGRWFVVAEDRAMEAVVRRLARHEQRCTGVKAEGREAA